MKSETENHLWGDYHIDCLSELASWNLHNKLVVERESAIVASMRRELMKRGSVNGNPDEDFSEKEVVKYCLHAGAIKIYQVHLEFIRANLQVHLAYLDPQSGKFVEDKEVLYTFSQYVANSEKMIQAGYKDVFFYPPNFSSYQQYLTWFKKEGSDRLLKHPEAIAA